MGTAVKIAFLVATIAFFAGCGGMQGAGSGGARFQYFAANCYSPSYTGVTSTGATATAAQWNNCWNNGACPVTSSVSPTSEGNPTYWCSNPPKVTTPSPTPSPSPGTSQ